MAAAPTERRIRAREITDDAFAPFGRVLSQDDDPPSRRVVARYSGGQEPMPSIIDEVNPDGVPRCGWLARHHHQTQALTPIDGPILLVLVPPGLDPRSEEGIAATAAFVADVAQGVQLDQGVWHWAASVRRGRVRVANLQGHRWPDDNEICDLAAAGSHWLPSHPWLDHQWAADLLATGTAALAGLPGAAVRPDLAVAADAAAAEARRLPDGDRWLVVDAAGAVELDGAAVEAAVRARPA